MDIYQFMLDIYEKDWRNGVPAPFLEYALSSSWMDKSYTHRNRIWMDGEQIVAFCFTENPVTDIYFSLRPGYEMLASEIIQYACEYMLNMNNKQQLILFKGQETLMDAAIKEGYQCIGKRVDMVFSFERTLEYELPEGFHFVEEDKINIEKVSECCWKGFDHEVEDGPWNGDAEHNYHLLQAPHATPQYTVVIENEKGEYVCYAGMWWTPQNHLAYMEPLCTVPSYRRKGLVAAALSELYRKMKEIGATHMTGGSNKFYSKIGFEPTIEWTFWRKNEMCEE
jgi:N-acetylglutamate synthase-like GNAT family acetyltransferase